MSGNTVIAVLGVGRVGSAVARQALRAGYTVAVSASGDPESIRLLVDIVIPGAEAMYATDAVKAADLVVLAVPLNKYRTLPVEALAGKTVIDAMNYWAPIDGAIPEFDDDDRSTGELVQAFLPKSHVVKSLNHIGYHELESDDRRAGADDRRALGVAGDGANAKALVAEFIDRLGYDVVDAGRLSMGRHFQPGTPIFSGSHRKADLTRILSDALSEVSEENPGLDHTGWPSNLLRV